MKIYLLAVRQNNGKNIILAFKTKKAREKESKFALKNYAQGVAYAETQHK